MSRAIKVKPGSYDILFPCLRHIPPRPVQLARAARARKAERPADDDLLFGFIPPRRVVWSNGPNPPNETVSPIPYLLQSKKIGVKPHTMISWLEALPELILSGISRR